MKRSIWAVIVLFAAAMSACGVGDETRYITDQSSGLQVKITVEGETATATNMQTGEMLSISLEEALSATNESYTAAMATKNAASRDGIVRRQQALSSGTRSYSMNNDYTTPSYNKSTAGTAVKTYLTGTSGYPSGDFVAVELKKEVAWWFDTSYGTRYFGTNPTGSLNSTWSSATDAGNYYLIISKDYNGSWTWGTFELFD